jgi:hypothetical protein
VGDVVKCEGDDEETVSRDRACQMGLLAGSAALRLLRPAELCNFLIRRRLYGAGGVEFL